MTTPGSLQKSRAQGAPTRNGAAPQPPDGAQAEIAAEVWRALEDLRAAYTCATPLPSATFSDVRAALGAIDLAAWGAQQPHAAALIASTLTELRGWERSWPKQPGSHVPPAAFGALVLLADFE